MQIISELDVRWLRRAPKVLAALTLFTLWLGGLLLLYYYASPFVPRFTLPGEQTTAPMLTSGVGFAEGGKTLLTVSRQDARTIRKWDAASGASRGVVETGAREDIFWLKVHAAGKYIEVYLTRRERVVYDVATAMPVLKIVDEADNSSGALLLTPDGKHLLFMAEKDKSYIAPVPFAAVTPPEKSRIPLSDFRGWSNATFSPDGRWLGAIQFEDRNLQVRVQVRVIDRVTGKLTLSMPGQKLPWFAFSPLGDRLLVVREDRIAVLDLPQGTEVLSRSLGFWLAEAYFLRDGNTVLGISPPQPRAGAKTVVHLFDVREGTERVLAELPGYYQFMKFSADHSKAIALREPDPDGRIERLLRWLNLRDSRGDRDRKRPYVGIDFSRGGTTFALPDDVLDFSAEGRSIVAADKDGTVAVWDFPPRQNGWRIGGMVALLLAPVFVLIGLRRRFVRRSRTPPAGRPAGRGA